MKLKTVNQQEKSMKSKADSLKRVRFEKTLDIIDK